MNRCLFNTEFILKVFYYELTCFQLYQDASGIKSIRHLIRIVYNKQKKKKKNYYETGQILPLAILVKKVFLANA